MHNGLTVSYVHINRIMHISDMHYCTYLELTSIEIPCLKRGLATFYAHMQIKHLPVMHSSVIAILTGASLKKPLRSIILRKLRGFPIDLMSLSL